MDTKRLVIIVVITLLACGNIYFGVMYVLQRMEAANLRQQFRVQQTNEKVLVFAKLFTDKILKESGEVTFDDRLRLENAVRDINDPEIFDQWKSFVESSGSQETQREVAKLFELFFDKIVK